MTTKDNLLKGIPQEILPSKVVSTQFIDGGLNNRNILVNNAILIKKFQVRDEKNDPIFLRYQREKETLLYLESLPQVPKLLSWYEKPPKLYLVREWVDGSPIVAKDLEKHAEMIIKSILEIHRNAKSLSADYDYFDVLKRYIVEYKAIEENEIFSKVNYDALPYYKDVERFFQEKLTILGSNIREENLVRIHGDLVLSNIILQENKPQVVFIDWEYSTSGNPLVDLAYLITQNKFTYDLQDLLIELFSQFSLYPVNRADLANISDLMILMSGLWYVIHASRLKLGSISSLSSGHQNTDSFLNLAIDQFLSLELI